MCCVITYLCYLCSFKINNNEKEGRKENYLSLRQGEKRGDEKGERERGKRGEKSDNGVGI